MTGLPLVNDLEQLLPKYIPKTIDFKEANMCFSLKDFKEGEEKKTVYHQRSSSSVSLIIVALLMKTHWRSLILLVRNGHPHTSTNNESRREPGEREPSTLSVGRYIVHSHCEGQPSLPEKKKKLSREAKLRI